MLRFAASELERIPVKVGKNEKKATGGLLAHPAMTEADQLGRLSGFITDGATLAPTGHRNTRFISHLSAPFPLAIDHHRPIRFTTSIKVLGGGSMPSQRLQDNRVSQNRTGLDCVENRRVGPYDVGAGEEDITNADSIVDRLTW